MKNTIITIIVLAIIIVLVALVIPKQTNAPVTQNQQQQPAQITYAGICPGFIVTSPAAGSTIAFPLTMNATVHPAGSPAGSWGVFEGQAGSVTIKDTQGNVLSQTIPLTLTQDWMTADPISFSVTVPSIAPQPAGSTIYVEFNDDDASGENPHQCVIEFQV